MSAQSSLHFAQIREDARIERRTFSHARRILAIASGGCTALSLLDDHVESVCAIDASPAQCALVELRKAAIFALDRDAYLAFVGERVSTTRSAVYRTLRAQLDSEARAFWDGREEDVAAGIDHAGSTERFYRFVAGALADTVLPVETALTFLRHDHTDAQLSFYREHIDGTPWRTAVRTLLSRTAHLAFFPAAMFAHARDRSFGDHFLERFELALGLHPLAMNYFLQQVLLGRYLGERDDAYPHYLTLDGYAAARRNIAKLHVVCSPLAAHLHAARDIDAFALSNVLDWTAPAEHDAFVRTLASAAAPGARFVVRFMLADATVPAALAACSVPLCDAASTAHDDRSGLYREIACGALS